MSFAMSQIETGKRSTTCKEKTVLAGKKRIQNFLLEKAKLTIFQ